MYKNFNLSEEEKRQIMEMHKNHGYKKPLNEQEEDVREYYKKFANQGATVIEPPIGKIEPHGNKPVYKLIGASIDSLL